MALREDFVEATVDLKFKPFMVPNFASIFGRDSADSTGFPVSDLSRHALDELAARWLEELYAKAAKRNPFRRPPEAG